MDYCGIFSSPLSASREANMACKPFQTPLISLSISSFSAQLNLFSLGKKKINNQKKEVEETWLPQAGSKTGRISMLLATHPACTAAQLLFSW